MTFTWTAKELNDEQSEAVLLEGSVFLVACPGSGKTRALTYKIAYELSRLKSPRQFVIAITYTHRAANEIVERIDELGVNTDRLWIGTIHAFCLEWLLKPYGIYLPALAKGFHVIDEHEREKLLEKLCAPYAAQRVTFYDCDYYIAGDGYHLGCPHFSKHETINQILSQYFDALSKKKQIDYELILWHALQLVKMHPPISQMLSKIFPIVLVDEYQDTKQIQYEVVAAILRAGGGATRLFMVGDPNQAIYGSLGGYPITIGDLRSMAAIPIEERMLSQNYRSSARVIKYFGNFSSFAASIEAAGDNREYPSLITYNSAVARDALVGEIARLIRFSVQTVGIQPSEICVLAPWWIHLASMTRWLVTQLPEYQFDGPGMVPFARDIENFWYKLARLALTEPSPDMYMRRVRWAGDVLDELSQAGVSLPRVDRKALLRECNSISVNETDGLPYLQAFFDALFLRIGVDYHAFAALEEHRNAFFAGSVARITRLEGEGVNGIRSLSFFKKVFQNRKGITVSTIHGVKGTEFDVVIAYALLEGMVPHFAEVAENRSAQKLLYVVGSRARKNLHLFSETGRRRGGGRGDYVPTEILARCAFNYDAV